MALTINSVSTGPRVDVSTVAPQLMAREDVARAVAVWLHDAGIHAPADMAEIAADCDAKITALSAVRDAARALAGMHEDAGHG